MPKQKRKTSSDVLFHWKNSYKIRKLEPAETIESFIEKWPILKSPLAPELVNVDFQIKHSQPEDFHLDNFHNFFDAVLALRKNSLTATDTTLLELLDGELTNGKYIIYSATAIKLYILPALVPPKTQVQAGKTNWKPSISEARDAFLVHVKIPGDLEKAKKDQIVYMFKKELTVQPYIILIEPTLSNITGSFVMVNNYEYKCNYTREWVRELSLRRILKAREISQETVRLKHFVVPKINFSATDYFELIYWNECDVTPSSVSSDFTDDILRDLIKETEIPDFHFLKFPVPQLACKCKKGCHGECACRKSSLKCLITCPHCKIACQYASNEDIDDLTDDEDDPQEVALQLSEN
ncbi:unnamed protein product [Psylliodes chrysocephalus]|uniref:Uncharacterized protein n=1 Tax=Psylliodes chrysocephalus TaxID=3402493 RepID=A0A9P0CME6_9CUCU|nr:unnamed protein product [Psylliodes chrysocephala]